MEAALQSAPAVMLAPAQPSLRTGPVIAIAASPNDPSVCTAAAIAIAAKEELVIIYSDATDESIASVRELYRSKDELTQGDSHRLFRVIHEGPAD
jgi:hypothetical protein